LHIHHHLLSHFPQPSHRGPINHLIRIPQVVIHFVQANNNDRHFPPTKKRPVKSVLPLLINRALYSYKKAFALSIQFVVR
jgi:hypothetical protein